jgi:thiol:disulfide interchange protein DsbA
MVRSDKLWQRVSACLALFAVSLAANAALVEGRDYRVLNPPKLTSDPGKIEVLEYFSWGCSHCYDLHPVLSAWKRTLPKDVVFVKAAVAVGFDQWVPLSRAFYALDYSGDIERLDGPIFKAIHEQRINLFTDENIAAWVEKQGIDRAKFVANAKSMGVDSKVRQAEANSRNVPIDGTPTLIVDGKYVLVGANAKTYADWMPILDQLIAKARADRGTKK